MNPQTPENEVKKPLSLPEVVLKQQQEIARLRDLLNRAIEIADNYQIAGLPRDGFMLHWKTNKHEFAKLKDTLAPAPEETETSAHPNKCIGNVTKIPHEGNNDAKFKQSEWRELGPDEVIQEGDQVQPKHHDRKGAWIWIWSHEIGATPRDQEAMRYRTRRPLPNSPKSEGIKKQEEKAPDHFHHWMRLQESINRAIADELQKLRDEIQKLK